MKANELMIGDWVKCKDPECKVHQVDLIDLGNEEVGIDGEYADLESIKPIPLTSEILEKNGFDYYHKNFASLSPEHPFKLGMVEWEEEYGKGGLWKFGDLIEIRYVHELQHLLKLCKIDNEIVLI